MEAMKEEMRLMKEELKKQQEETLKQLEAKEQLQLQLLTQKSSSKKAGKPKAEVPHQPHFRFRTVKLENGDEEILMLDSEEGQEIPLYEKKVEFSAQLEQMKSRFSEEYEDCRHLYEEDFFDEDIDEHFGSNLDLNERDVFYLKDRTKYWNEMTKEELIKECGKKHWLGDFKSRTKTNLIEPNWAKTEEGVWVKWGKGTLFGLKKDSDGVNLKPKVAINMKTAEGRKQIKTAPDESRCEANASKKAGRCCKGAMFQIPEDGKRVSRQVCITHMKAAHQTSIICNKPLAFGGRWGWYDKPLTCFTIGENKTSKSIDQYCKDKLKADQFLEAGFKQIKGNNYTRDELGNSSGYSKFKIN